MASETNSAQRVTEIVDLLRPERPRTLPDSLTAAAKQGDLERMQLFMDRGANIEERSAWFASPLAAACSSGQLEAARWLIANGALLDLPEAQFSPIQLALGKLNCEAAAVLLDAGLPIEKAAWGVLVAATMGKLDMLRWLVGRGVDLDKSYPGVGVPRERALFAARKGGHDEMMRFLQGEFDPGPPPVAPPPAQRPGQVRPRAAPADRARLLEEALELVRAGGKAAAHWKATGPAAVKRELLISLAAGNGVAEIVIALLNAGAKPNFSLEGTPPPLTRAAEEAQTDIVRILLERGALPNGKDGKSWLPLVGAVMSGDPEVVKILLDAGANPRAKPAGGASIAGYMRGPYTAEIRALLEQASIPATPGKPNARRSDT